MKPPLILRDDTRELLALVEAGRKAAALDGRHLVLWGLIGASCLALQYLAEVGDWLPSSQLWLWQPLALFGFAGSLFVARRGAGRRLGHPVARTYAVAFASAGIALAGSMLAAGADARPDGFVTTVLVTATLGAAFLALSLASPLRWMMLPGVGWFGLTAFYLAQQAVVPVDWLRLSLAFALLLALPGGVLIAKEPK
jgi:hypothetical protein